MAPENLTEVGLNWYATARQIALEIGDGDLKLGAGLLAAISPQMPWERNVKLAAQTMLRDFRGLTDDKIAKCRAILDGVDPWLVLRGFKVRSFYANILGFENYVTVDTWMSQHYVPGKPYPDTAARTNKAGRKLYNKIASRIRREAKQAGVTPAQWQAIVWCHLRQKGG